MFHIDLIICLWYAVTTTDNEWLKQIYSFDALLKEIDRKEKVSKLKLSKKIKNEFIEFLFCINIYNIITVWYMFFGCFGFVNPHKHFSYGFQQLIIKCEWDESVCCICLEESSEYTLYVTDCGHKYHTKCLIKWIQTSDKKDCPMCRQSLAKSSS